MYNREVPMEEYYREADAFSRMFPVKNVYLRSALRAQMILTNGRVRLSHADRDYYQRIRDFNVALYRKEISG
jgi:hypothetical protein